MRPDITLWQPLPSEATITLTDVHLWSFPVTISPNIVERCRTLLSETERNSARRLADQKKSMHFIAARAFLRIILGRYLDLKADQIIFRYNDYGKPSLDPVHGSDLCFNLAHSSGQAILGLARAEKMGVDIEFIDPSLDYRSISKHYFSEAEKLRLELAPQYKRRRIFYRLWTCREARLKKIGKGLTAFHDQCAQKSVVCRFFPFPAHFIACLAVQSEVNRIHRFRIPDVNSLFLSDHHSRR